MNEFQKCFLYLRIRLGLSQLYVSCNNSSGLLLIVVVGIVVLGDALCGVQLGCEGNSPVLQYHSALYVLSGIGSDLHPHLRSRDLVVHHLLELPGRALYSELHNTLLSIQYKEI